MDDQWHRLRVDFDDVRLLFHIGYVNVHEANGLFGANSRRNDPFRLWPVWAMTATASLAGTVRWFVLVLRLAVDAVALENGHGQQQQKCLKQTDDRSQLEDTHREHTFIAIFIMVDDGTVHGVTPLFHHLIYRWTALANLIWPDHRL